MSAGKRFKFQGSTIQVLTGYATSSPGDEITGITNANPAVVHEPSHTRATGDVVRITGVVGMTEVNNGVFIIEKVDANYYNLVDVDSSGYGAYTSGGSVEGGVFSNFCELKGYNRQGGSSPELDATTVCSEAQEFEIGLPNFGTTQLDFNFAPRTAVQLAVAAYYSGSSKGQTWAVRIALPNSGGNMAQLGFIQQTSEQAATNGLWAASMTVRNTGVRYDYLAA